jgi:signal transduction histidine kinase
MSEEHSRRVLVVDDELPIGVGVCSLLDVEGFESDYVLSAEEALEYLDKSPEVDIILLDIHLGPGMSGIEVLPYIRQKNKYVQTIMLTSDDTLEKGLESMKNGAFDYLSKPFNEQEFLQKVPGALQRKRLAQLNDLYLGILVHDMKNPLQTIIGAVQLMEATLPQPDAMQSRALHAATGGIGQIRAIINNILSISKFETGSFTLRPSEISLTATLQEVFSEFDSELQMQQKKVEVQVSGDECMPIATDKELLGSILVNILSNAIRHAAAQSTIIATVEKTREDRYSVGITNSGSYIDEKMRDVVFDKFAKVTLARSAGGSMNFGLGLTFCRMAVEVLGGQIWVEADENVPSTTFRFTLPRHVRHSATEQNAEMFAT